MESEVHHVFREHITINICVKDFFREHTFVKSLRDLRSIKFLGDTLLSTYV
jgi:hypothetical protein